MKALEPDLGGLKSVKYNSLLNKQWPAGLEDWKKWYSGISAQLNECVLIMIAWQSQGWFLRPEKQEMYFPVRRELTAN